jgi:type IV secretory pathway VirB2 component (pilin)
MDTLVDFLNWAWERHHNPLSWYIRPLFILPFCYFAYKRNFWGLVATVAAVMSSMFWFPAPATPDPQAAAFLTAERQYVTGPVTFGKLVLVALVPIWFAGLAWAFRRRSWVGGALIIAAGTLLKVVWSFMVAGESAWAIIPPVALGTAVCAGVLLLAYERRDRTA